MDRCAAETDDRIPSATIGTVTTPAIAAGYNYPNDLDANGAATAAPPMKRACSPPCHRLRLSLLLQDLPASGSATPRTAAVRARARAVHARMPVSSRYVRYSASHEQRFRVGPDGVQARRYHPRPDGRGQPAWRRPTQAGVLTRKRWRISPSGTRSYRTRMLAMKTAGGFAFSALAR